MGKIFITTELGGGGTATAASAEIAKRGVMNVLRHAGIVAGKPETGQTVWLGMPDGDCFSFAQENGLLEPAVDLVGAVAKGTVVDRNLQIGRPSIPPVTKL